MILLDTHMWVWWVQGDPRLSPNEVALLDQKAPSGIGVSVFSCWEVAMLHSRERLILPCGLDEWMETALGYPGVQQIGLSRSVAVESCRLPGDFHRDPADRILVATARELDCVFVTADDHILRYDHVRACLPRDLPQKTAD